jgi:hypothetical protein
LTESRGAEGRFQGFRGFLSYKPDISYVPSPPKIINFKIPDYKAMWLASAHRLYPLAVKWAIGGDAKYAEAAIKILKAWSST